MNWWAFIHLHMEIIYIGFHIVDLCTYLVTSVIIKTGKIKVNKQTVVHI